MKNKSKLIIAIFILISCHAFAQHGHSINSNSIIHQVPRMNGAAHANANANANAINHANSNSIFGNAHNKHKHDNQEKDVVKDGTDDKAKKDGDEPTKKHKRSRKHI